MTSGSITPVSQTSTGISYIHGLISYNGYLYGSQKNPPGKIVKINATDYTDKTVVTITRDGVNAQSLNDILEVGDYIYTCDDLGYLYKLSPTNLTTVSYVQLFASSAQSLESDGTYIFACGQDGYVARYTIATAAFVAAQIVAGKIFHSLVEDGDYLYVSDTSDYVMRKIVKSTLAQDSVSASYGRVVTDDMAQDSNYVYGGGESSPYGIVRVAKTDLAYQLFNFSGIGKSFGVFIVEDALLYLDKDNNIIWVLTFPVIAVNYKLTLQGLSGSGGINELATTTDYIHLTQWDTNAYAIKFNYTDIIRGYLLPGYTLEGTDFTTLMDTFKRGFRGNPDFDVTRSALSFGERDSTTGWYAKNYADSTIKMVIIQKEYQNMALRLGYWVNLDALGLTIAPIDVYDLITDKFERTWEIKTVKPIMVGDTVKYFVCDLKELPLHGL